MLRIAFSIYPGVLGNVNGGELDWAEEHEGDACGPVTHAVTHAVDVCEGEVPDRVPGCPSGQGAPV